MSNLLSYNVSNQNYFRETGFVPKLAKLLTLSEEELNPFAKDQRDTNIQYALRLVRLFVVPGGLGTAANQNALVATGILHLVIQIAFLSSCDISVRAQALKAVADLIDGNEALQHSFAQIQVALPHLQPPPGAEEGGGENGEAHCGVIEALLDLALWDNTVGNIDNRFAACRCLEAYFNGNSPVRTFFLKHAIQLHTEADESPNAITSLLHLDPAARGDPYRVWIASVIMIHLIYDDTEAKIMATEMREGDAEAGEEVVTAIQSCSANLITALQHQYDTRICIGYLMLLCMWLYGDSDAVDDFLSETSSVQALVGAVKENGVDPIVQGLSTFLLGILYEFSHRDSPVTRTHLHQLLATQMTRDLYVNKITQLRSNPLIRDFEVSKDDLMPGHHRRKHGLPEVYFDQIFIEFLKENYGNVLRAIDKAPELDTRVSGNGIVKTSNGVNLEELEDLRKQLAIKTEELEQIETARQKEKTLMEQQHSASLQRIEDARYKDLETIKAAQTSALAEAEKARRAAEQQLQTAQTSGKRARDALAAEQKKNREEIEKIRQAAAEEKAKSDDNFRKVAQDMTERNRRTVEEKENQLKALREQIKEIPGLKREVEERAEKLDNMRRQAEELVKRTNEIVAEREGRIKELNEALREAGQREQGLKQQINQATKETAEVKKQLDAEAKNSEQMIQQSDAEIQKLNASIQQLQNQLQEAQNQIQQAHAETKRVRDEMQQQLVIKAGAEKCLQDSTAMVARKNKEIEEKQQQAEAAQKVVKEKEEKIKFLEDTAAAERKHADQRIEELEKAVESSKKDSEAEKKKLDAKVKELEKKAEEARKETEAAQKAADENQQQLIEAQEAAKKQAAELKEQDKSADAAKLAALEKEKEALQKQLGEASEAQEVAKKQAAELAKEKSADAAKLAALEKEKEELQKQLTEASEAATKVAALEEANKKLTALEGAQEKLKTVSAEKEEAKKKAEEVQQELDDLFMVLGDLEEKRKADKVCFFLNPGGYFQFR
jgi:hypothetical protein